MLEVVFGDSAAGSLSVAIGRVLGQAPIGVGDTWFSLRIEQMIRDGLLEPVTQPKPGDPAYHRILRKCAGK